MSPLSSVPIFTAGSIGSGVGSGSGAAISANLAAASLGTETDGSIVCPASACGLVGIKPTVGLTSSGLASARQHDEPDSDPLRRSRHCRQRRIPLAWSLHSTLGARLRRTCNEEAPQND